MAEVFKALQKSNFISKNSIIIYQYFFKRNIENEIHNSKIMKNSNFGDKIVSYLSL